MTVNEDRSPVSGVTQASTEGDCPTCGKPAGQRCFPDALNHVSRGLALALARSPYEAMA